MMVTEVKIENVVTSTERKEMGAGQVHPVTEPRAAQPLPGDGKPLPQQQEQVASKKAIEPEKLDDVVRDLNEHVQHVKRELRFSVDNDSGRTVIKVLDRETDNVIRQIPGEEALNFARKLDEGAELEIFSAFT